MIQFFSSTISLLSFSHPCQILDKVLNRSLLLYGYYPPLLSSSSSSSASMSLLFFPHSLSLPFSPKPSCISRNAICHSSSLSVSSPLARESTDREKGIAVLWYKHDLRIDDHPGLVAASRYRAVVPLYVFDRRILSRFSDEKLELIMFAIEDLRNSLKDMGSDLMIRVGSAEKIISDLAKEVRATHIIAEEEVEYELLRMMDVVKETLAATPYVEGSTKISLWHNPFYDTKSLKDLPASYHDFKKLQISITSPLVPQILPGVKIELDWGPLPAFGDLKKFMNDKPNKSEASWSSIKETSAETILQKKRTTQDDPLNNLTERLESLKSEDVQRIKVKNSVFVTQKGNSVGGGTNAVLNALAAYLRYLEGTARDDWQEVHEKLRNAETRNGASFGTLFGSALYLGIISRRRVHYEAIKYEKERNSGFISPFGYSAVTVAAAVDAVCSMEWYWLMALKSQISDEGPYSIRIWRWNGFLIQYTVAGHEGPAILLVHGFGAFLEHYRDNINGIADGGNRVWAISLLGFGKSEKPNVVYTELKWADLLKDFIIEVVGEPVHLVGNSIGGYFVAIVAGIFPALAKSIVIINSAGNVVPGYSSVAFFKERRSSGAAWLGARLLLNFLRLRIKNIVCNCYPTKPERVDDWLIEEMTRASYDPGVLVVLESIFSFNLSIPLNYLLEGYKERVLIIQGMKDPISDSKSKLAMLREHCSGILIRELDAGHCPHDEQPEKVNSMISQWIETIESKLPVESCL